MKNKIKKIIAIFLLTIFSLNISTIVKADSGWDSSYDSGGSSDWSSGSSDWGSSGSYSSSSSSTSGDLGTVIFFVMIIIVIIIVSKNNPNNGSGSSNSTGKYQDIDEKDIEKYGLTLKELKDMTYSLYKNVQNAWTDLDYKKLRKYLTDEIYNSYTMQLDTLKVKHQKNIMKDFEYVDAKIIETKEENGLLNIKVYLNVKMYDYVVDKDNKTIRGNDKKRINIEYVINLVKSSTKNKEDETICPNCGAKIESTAGGTCEYCGSAVVEDAKEFVMSSKTCIGQRFE